VSARIIQGNVFDVLPTLTPGSVDCVVTSVPYWMLRSYLPKDHPLKSLELGSEPSPAAYVANMVKVFGLVRDVMAEHAVCFLNVGDTYAYDGKWGGATSGRHRSELHRKNGLPREKRGTETGLGDGSLCLIPQRLAIALQDDGWIVRSVIVWHKPAPMPSSVSGWAWRRCRVKLKGFGRANNEKNSQHQNAMASGLSRFNGGVEDPALAAQYKDCHGCRHCTPHGGYRLRRGSWRPTSSWEPVLMLAKSPRYFADGEPVRQPSAAATVSRNEYSRIIDDPDEQFAVKHDHETTADGANLRDVWTIAAEPLKEKHYAAFPTELVHRCLAAGTSAKGYCPACGAPWVRCIEENFRQTQNGVRADAKGLNELDGRGGYPRGVTETTTTGWRPSCPCPPSGPRPGLVLDPFAGSGRTGIEALRMGLDFIGIDLNEEYCTMSRRLLREESPLFAGA
jgi:DNA modification methylase